MDGVDDGYGQIQDSDGEEIGQDLGADFYKGEDLGALFSGVKNLIKGSEVVEEPEVQIAKTIEIEKPLYTVLEETQVTQQDGQIF